MTYNYKSRLEKVEKSVKPEQRTLHRVFTDPKTGTRMLEWYIPETNTRLILPDDGRDGLGDEWNEQEEQTGGDEHEHN